MQGLQITAQRCLACYLADADDVPGQPAALAHDPIGVGRRCGGIGMAVHQGQHLALVLGHGIVLSGQAEMLAGRGGHVAAGKIAFVAFNGRSARSIRAGTRPRRAPGWPAGLSVACFTHEKARAGGPGKWNREGIDQERNRPAAGSRHRAAACPGRSAACSCVPDRRTGHAPDHRWRRRRCRPPLDRCSRSTRRDNRHAPASHMPAMICLPGSCCPLRSIAVVSSNSTICLSSPILRSMNQTSSGSARQDPRWDCLPRSWRHPGTWPVSAGG